MQLSCLTRHVRLRRSARTRPARGSRPASSRGSRPSPTRSAATILAATSACAVLVGVVGVATPASAAKKPADKTPRTGTVWLCRPGMADDPCAFSRTGTAVAPTGAHSGATLAAAPPSTGAKFDCFYAYPTVSKQKSLNATLTVQPAETDAAIDQASLFSQVCTVWAPMYKQATLADLIGLSATTAPASLLKAGNVAFNSLLAAWKVFLAKDDHGRPIVLIGHSQGAVALIHLIATRIDTDPSLRSKLVVAILAGGNLQVPQTKTAGATFKNVPLCTGATETGCVIAWSSFPSEPPADSLFGRPGQGVSLQGLQTAKAGQQVACVNPAALSGGTGDLDPWFISLTQQLSPAVSTLWVTYPDLYTATCESRGGASWLQVADIAASGDTRPVVTESEGPTWGYHTWDVNLALGNLVPDVAGEEKAYAAAHA
jgi:hypothetical protein